MREKDFDQLLETAADELLNFYKEKIHEIDHEYNLNPQECVNLHLNMASNLCVRSIIISAMNIFCNSNKNGKSIVEDLKKTFVENLFEGIDGNINKQDSFEGLRKNKEG